LSENNHLNNIEKNFIVFIHKSDIVSSAWCWLVEELSRLIG